MKSRIACCFSVSMPGLIPEHLYGSQARVKHSERGIGLVMALMTLLLLSLLTATTVDVWIGDNYRTSTQLLYVTASGIEDGREMLTRAPILPSSQPFIV